MLIEPTVICTPRCTKLEALALSVTINTTKYLPRVLTWPAIWVQQPVAWLRLVPGGSPYVKPAGTVIPAGGEAKTCQV